MYLVIRLASLIHVAAAAECYGLTRAKGVSPQLVYDLIAGAAGSSSQFNLFFPSMISRDYKPNTTGAFNTLGGGVNDLVQYSPLTP